MSSPIDPTDYEPPPGVVADATVRTGAGTPVSTQVMLTNRASEPRIMAITALGADPSWLPGPSRSRVLRPGESVLAELRLSPAPGTLPARYPVALAIQALDPITGQASSATALGELQLIVDAPGQIGIELAPLDATAVFGKKIAVTLRNTGASAAEVRLDAQATQSTPVRLDETDVPVRSGEVRTVRGRVRVRRVRLIGHRARHTYSITAHSAGAPRHVEGSLTARAMLGPTSAKVTALAALVAVWVALAIIFIPKLADSIKDNHKITAKSVQTSGAAGGSGTAAGGGSSGGSDKDGSSGGPNGTAGGAGGSRGGTHGGAGTAAGAAAIQLNGTVTGAKPGGVDVTIEQTTLHAEDAIDATPVGIAPQSLHTVGKISSAALLTRVNPDQPSSRSVVTDTDGAWSFANVAQPGYYLVTFAKPGYQTVRYIVNSASAAASKPMKVTLVPGQGKLSGTISGPNGPVGGAQITITDGTNTITTSSNSQGHVGAWSVDGLSTPSSYLISASKSGMSTESTLVTLGAGDSSSVSLRLRLGSGSLIGLVSGNDGRLGGASVTATNGKITRTATTVTKGAVGRYVLPDLPEPGTYTVTVAAKGYQPQSQRVRLHAGQSSARVDAALVSATATINGAVESQGKPVAGAGLMLSSTENTYKLTSTNRGGFSFDGVTAGTYVLSAQYFGLVTGYVTIKAVPGQTHFTTINLKPAAKTVSHSSVTGFVADGGNPSNTLCAVTDTDCRVSFQLCAAHAGDDGLCTSADALVISADGKTFSKNPSIVPARSGPTAYTLIAPEDVGLTPGLYRLVISVTDHNQLVSYLPATVNVRVPLNGVARAPQVSLYTASTISGVVRSTFDWSAPGAYDSCVWAIPSDSDFAPTDCAPKYDPPETSPCAASGTPSPTVGAIQTDGGGYSITGLCNGSYQMVIITTNPDFEPTPKSASQFVRVMNGSPGYFNGQIFRKARIQFFLTYPSTIDSSAVALSNTRLDAGSKCRPTGSAGSPIDLAGKKTDRTGRLLITGLTPATYHCTLNATTPAGRAVSATTPADVTINWDSTNVVHLVLAAPIDVFVGQVTTSWSGSQQPVPDIRVAVSGVVGYDNDRRPTNDSVTVAADSNGCFAIAPLGSTPPPTPAQGPCADDDSIPTAYLDLKVPKASFDIVAQRGYQQASRHDVNVSINPNTSVVDLNLDPNPVDFRATVSAPDSVDLASVKVDVVDSASGSGNITAKINVDPSDSTTGTLGWHDSIHGDAAIVPGSYTLRFSGPDLPTWSYRIACTLVNTCTKTFTLHRFGTLGIQVPDGAKVTLMNHGKQVRGPKTASDGSVTFENLLPSEGYIAQSDGSSSWAHYRKPSYSVQVHAAGYQFGTTGTESSPVSIACGTYPENMVPIVEGDMTCTVTLTPDGSISGTLTGIKAKEPADKPTHKLNGVRVTATLCQDKVSLPAHDCTPASGAAARTFFDMTDSDGTYTVTGTNDTQGLDPGYWLVTTHAVGYGDPDGTGAPRSKVVHLTADSLTQTADFDLYVAWVDTFTVTVKDGSGNVLTDRTVTSVTIEPSGGGKLLTADYDSASKAFTFTDLIPGKYDVSATGTQFSLSTDNGVDVDAGNTSHDLIVGLHSNTVTGTVVGEQGDDGIAGLANVKVRIGTVDDDGTFHVAHSLDKDHDKLVATTSSNPGTVGAFRFTAVPNSPSGGWVVQLTRTGYELTKDTLIVDALHVQQGLLYSMPRITHDVSIDVTSTSSDDDLSDVTAKLVSVAGSEHRPENTTQTLAITTETSKSSITASASSVPYGCWKLVADLPPGHYGTLSITSAPDDDSYLACPDGSITVPSTGEAEVAASYQLDESALEISVTATPSASDAEGRPDSVPAMHVTVSDDSDSTTKALYNNTDFPTDATVTVWLPTSQTYTASVQPADSDLGIAWPTGSQSTESGITLTTSDSTTADLTISELPVLQLTVDGASESNEATVTVSAADDQSVPTAYQDGILTSGTAELYLPAGDWDVTATLGTAPNQQADSARVRLAVDAAAVKKLTPAWASLTVNVAGAADDTATVVLTCTGNGQTHPAGCAEGITPQTDDGDGTTFTGLAAGSWMIHATTAAGKGVTKPVTLDAGEIRIDDDGVAVDPQWASITVTVKDAKGANGKLVEGASVTFEPGEKQTVPADASGKTGSDGTFSVDDLPVGSWNVTAVYTDKNKNKTSGQQNDVRLHGGSNTGITIILS